MATNGRIGLTQRECERLEKRFDLQRRAEAVLDLIVAEFKSDPMSVQCFDLRIVNEAIAVSDGFKEVKDYSDEVRRHPSKDQKSNA